MQDFNDKVAVITGGANGVGRSLAFALGREGAKVVVSDVEEGALEKTVNELQAENIDAIGVIADVTRQESLEALAASALKKYGGMHLVFANAGVGTGEAGPMWTYDANDWQWGFNVNFWGVVNSVNTFMPKLIAQNEEAHFVITGSGNGAYIMLPVTPIYTASKAAVQAVTENLFFQVKDMDTPVKINGLFPGPHTVDTGIFNSERNRPADLPAVGEKASGITSADDMINIMKDMGVDFKVTHPDEVAEFALQGLRDEKFWLSRVTDDTKVKMRQRFDSIVDMTDPPVPQLG